MLSPLTTPGEPIWGELVGEDLFAFSKAASLSLIWNVEGEFRRLETGEMSLRTVLVSSLTPASWVLEVVFAMRRGFTDVPAADLVGRSREDDGADVVVPARRRELRLGGTFSVSAMATTTMAGQKVEETMGNLCGLAGVNVCPDSVCDVSCPS